MSLRVQSSSFHQTINRHGRNNVRARDLSQEKLSTGSRINRAADDAAGLGISENLRADSRSLRQAERNAQDGVSLIQVAEGAIQSMSNILTRLRELSIQAASDTVGQSERLMMNKEVVHLRQEIDRIAESTEFKGQKILNGSGEMIGIQVGINSTDEQSEFIYDVAAFDNRISNMGIGDVNTLTKEAAQTNLNKIDNAIKHLNENRASMGALQNRLEVTSNNIITAREQVSAGKSRVKDTDYAIETSEYLKHKFMAGISLNMVKKADVFHKAALRLAEMSAM